MDIPHRDRWMLWLAAGFSLVLILGALVYTILQLSTDDCTTVRTEQRLDDTQVIRREETRCD